MQFKDHFSTASDKYHKYRPGYPTELFQWLAAISNGHDLAWDCATGTGQAARQLAPLYKRIIATDASRQQINQAETAANIHYSVATETNPNIADNSLDLLTIAQAIHWFDTGIFFREVTRVMKPGGVLAIWGYNLLHINHEIDEIINDLYWNTLSGYWPEERRILEQGYSTFELPFTEIQTPEFEMTQQWSLEQLLGYLGTWSAVRRYMKDKRENPLERVRKSIHALWTENEALPITWPLTLRVALSREQRALIST